jgi:hypothetical protein
MDQNEQKFIKGFNGGYLLAKHEPTLTDKIFQKLEPVNEYTKGLISGKEEWTKEKEQEQLRELDNLRNPSLELGNDLERDLDE